MALNKWRVNSHRGQSFIDYQIIKPTMSRSNYPNQQQDADEVAHCMQQLSLGRGPRQKKSRSSHHQVLFDSKKDYVKWQQGRDEAWRNG